MYKAETYQPYDHNPNPEVRLFFIVPQELIKEYFRAQHWTGDPARFYLRYYPFNDFYDIDYSSICMPKDPAMFLPKIFFKAKSTVRPMLADRIVYWMEHILSVSEPEHTSDRISIRGTVDSRVRSGPAPDFIMVDDLDFPQIKPPNPEDWHKFYKTFNINNGWPNPQPRTTVVPGQDFSNLITNDNNKT